MSNSWKLQGFKTIYSNSGFSLTWIWSILKNKDHMGITHICPRMYIHKMGIHRSMKKLRIKKIFSNLLLFQQIVRKKLKSSELAKWRMKSERWKRRFYFIGDCRDAFATEKCFIVFLPHMVFNVSYDPFGGHLDIVWGSYTKVILKLLFTYNL